MGKLETTSFAGYHLFWTQFVLDKLKKDFVTQLFALSLSRYMPKNPSDFWHQCYLGCPTHHSVWAFGADRVSGFMIPLPTLHVAPHGCQTPPHHWSRCVAPRDVLPPGMCYPQGGEAPLWLNYPPPLCPVVDGDGDFEVPWPFWVKSPVPFSMLDKWAPWPRDLWGCGLTQGGHLKRWHRIAVNTNSLCVFGYRCTYCVSPSRLYVCGEFSLS